MTEGIHKVALVASLATVDDEAIWADKIQHMSKPAVQELTKEVRYKIENGNCKTTLCSAAPQRIRVDLEGELFFLFLKLKKKYGEKMTNLEVMQKIFEENLDMGQRETSNDHQKHKVVKEERVEAHENEKIEQSQSAKVVPGDRNSRYISIRIRRNLLRKTAGKCSYPECQRPAQVFHHTDRFANSRSHESLRPVCRIHHEFAHNGLIQNEKSEAQDWQLQLQNGELEKIDQLYREYRKYQKNAQI